jgi:hypothetical protein
VPLQDCQSSQLREAEQIVLTPSGTLVVVDSPFFRARSWVKGPPVLVSDGVMVLSQLFLKVNTWSAMAGVLIARAMARAAVTRENMLRRCARRLEDAKGGRLRGCWDAAEQTQLDFRDFYTRSSLLLHNKQSLCANCDDSAGTMLYSDHPRILS